MDLDDIIKAVIPKSKRKKLKKEIKKKGKKQVKNGSLTSLIKSILTAILAIFFGRGSDKEAASPAVQTRPRQTQKQATSKPIPFRNELAQAYSYQAKIEALARQTPADSVAHTRLTLLSDRIRDWVNHIEEIVQRTSAHQDDPLLAADRKQVPEAIKRLEKQLEKAKDPALRQKLERTLDNRRKQLAQLEQADNQEQLTALKVENTLAQLGLIYSQIFSTQFTAEQGGYERLTAEIEEEIHTLDDYLATLQELQEPQNTWT